MVAKTKNLCFIAFYLLVGGCYNEKFAEIPDSVTIKPAIALPLAIGAFTIDKSLVLYGVPEINLDEDLPSWAQQKRVAFHDTLSFAISGIEKEVEEIISLTINLIVYNDFPSSAEIQVFFLNEEFEKNDSLFVPSRLVVNPGEIDGFGQVIARGYSVISIPISKGKIDLLTESTRLLFLGEVSNIGIPISYFEHYPKLQATLKLSAKLEMSIDL